MRRVLETRATIISFAWRKALWTEASGPVSVTFGC